MIVERDTLSHHVRTAAILPLPETVAEDGGSRTAPLVIGCGKRAAYQRVQAERVKKLTRSVVSLRVARFATRRQIEASATVGEDSGEHVLAVAKLLPNRVGENCVLAHGHLQQLFGMGDGQRFEN